MTMKVLFLGTGAGLPAKARNVSSTALKLLDELNEVWLFDCGEATQHQILKTTLKPRKISNIFITHLHGDHIFGLPGFLCSRSFQGAQGGSLVIYGPEGIGQFIKSSLRFSYSKLTYSLKIVELKKTGGIIKMANGWQVQYLPLDHGVPCFGYRIVEPDQDGQLLVDQLAAYHIPNGPIFGRLKRGEVVELEDGTILDGKDYIGPSKKGRIITVLGDTRYCDNAIELARNADVLIHEATYEAGEEKMAMAHFHSTTRQAANVASQANVKQLFLNHISARYLGHDIKRLESEARDTFVPTRIVYDLNEYDID